MSADGTGGVAGAAAPLPAPEAVPAARPVEERLSFVERFSDRVNPILVRETQQAMSGRAFAGALTAALLAVVLVALSASAGGTGTRERGWSAFVLGMQVLSPILFLVVPMQAYLSMRQEVTAGTVEHLLLSRLSPGAVVRGKVGAAVLESLLFFSVFAPLLALTYLLRGVDVPTIALALGLALVYAAAAATFAVAMGALSRAAGFRALPMLVLALGLIVGTAVVTVGMPYQLRALMFFRAAGEDGPGPMLTWTMPAVVVTPLLYIAACAALAHPYENRSTAFRLYGVAALVGVTGWAGWLASFGESGLSGEVVPGVVALGAAFALPFWLFAVTEENGLSPRVRTLVPKNPLLAAIAIPFLPGGSRGLLYVTVLASIALLIAGVLPHWIEGVEARENEWDVAAVAWAYVLVYCAIGRGLRRVAPPGLRATVLVRLGLLAIGLLLAFVPTFLDMFADRRLAVHREPSVVDVLNPFMTIRQVGRGWKTDGYFVVSLLAIVGLLAHLPDLLRGVGEVLKASRERRGRAA